MEYLKPKELRNGHLYLISARNARIGIWCKELGGFVISRHKFGDNFVFVEYHWDLGGQFGTVKPIQHLEKAPFNPAIFLFWLSDERQVLTYLNDKAEEHGGQFR